MKPILYFDRYLDEQKVQEFKDLIGFDTINSKYETSHFYNSGNDSVVIDKHIRSSEKIQFRTDVVFDWYENNIIKRLNKEQDEMYYILLRDDVEMIRYKEGDFFKRHIDTINFYSNEFKSYTCILNIQPCESGGDTVIYDEDGEEHRYNNSSKSGSVLIFQKQLEHEGAVIEKGEKIITVGNVMAYPKGKYDDVLIVLIEKSNNTYFVPISVLEKFKHTMYYAYYSFEKIQNPDKKIFRYTEYVLDDKDFRIFYDILFPNKNKKNLEILDYIGIEKSDVYSDFTDFVNGRETYATENQSNISEGIFFCSMDDYYYLNKLIDPKEITPFQLITFEYNNGSEDYYYGRKKEQIVTWFGLHDNLFVTCDYVENKKSRCSYVTDKSHLKYMDDEYIKKLESLEINSAKVFDIYGGIHVLSGESKKYTNKFLYELNKFRKMNEITFSKSDDPYICMNKYVVELMKSIETCHGGDGYSEKNSSIIHELLDQSYKLYDYEKVTSNIEIDKTQLDQYDWIDFMGSILKTSLVSNIKRASTSAELTCNSAQYTIYDVAYRFGFVKNSRLKKRIPENIEELGNNLIDHNNKKCTRHFDSDGEYDSE